MFAINCGVIVSDFQIFEKYLIVCGQKFLKVFDVANWTGELLSGLDSEEITKISLSQTGLIAATTSHSVKIFSLKQLLENWNEALQTAGGQQYILLDQQVISSFDQVGSCYAQFRNFYDNLGISSTTFQ